MAFLFQGQPKVIPEFTGLQVNTAVQALPIPIIYGSPRCSLNLIYYNGFQVILANTGQGGSGLLTGGKGQQEVQYFATLILAIGEGTVSEVVIIYADQGVYLPSDFPSNGLVFFEGTDDQQPWDFITGSWPVDARSYKDTCYYGAMNAQLDSSATVPQLNVVPKGIFTATCPLNNSTITITSGQYDSQGNPISYLGPINLGDADADPATCINDFLTNSRYGAGFPAQFINTGQIFSGGNAFVPGVGDDAFQTYCQAVGFGWSVCINNVESASSLLDRWTKNLGVAPVWNGEILSLIPYWDQPASGNPGWDPNNGLALKYFTPNTTPVVQLTTDYLLQADNQTDDPISFERKDPLEVYNTVRVDFRDRDNFFNDNVMEAKDEAHIELYGPRVDNVGMADEFTLADYANASATIQLRRNISIMRTFTFRLGPLWAFLDPMDLVIIPDPADWTQNLTVRIISIEDDENEISTVTAEEFPLGAQSATFMPPPPSGPPNQGATNNPVGCCYPPVIFEPPSAMLTATGFSAPQVIIGASSGANDQIDPNWGGCFIWVSLDNSNYSKIGALQGPSTIGFLAENLLAPAGPNPDNTNNLLVDLGESSGVLDTVDSVSAARGKSLCIVQDLSGYELLGYTGALLTAGHTFELSGLYRGLYGSTARAFAAGSQFLYIGTDANIFETALPPQYVGNSFYVKLQSFNIFNNFTADLGLCAPFVYIATGPTPPPLAPPPSKAVSRPAMIQIPKIRPNRRRLL